MINKTYESIMTSVLIVATVWCYCKMRVLDVNPNPISFLDDTLLFVCLPAHFVFGFVNIMPAIFDPGTAPTLQIVKNVLMVVQVLLQTPMIVDGLRRCSDSPENQRVRPGRQLITFLIASNLAMYVWDTFELKSYELQHDRIEFYGELLWTFLSHSTMPLIIFYRFHSSVALVDIWSSAYKPATVAH